MNSRWPGSSVHGISQARILEWVAIPFSRGSSRLKDWFCVSCIGRRILSSWATREALMNQYSGVSKKSCTIILFSMHWSFLPMNLQALSGQDLCILLGMHWVLCACSKPPVNAFLNQSQLWWLRGDLSAARDHWHVIPSLSLAAIFVIACYRGKSLQTKFVSVIELTFHYCFRWCFVLQAKQHEVASPIF